MTTVTTATATTMTTTTTTGKQEHEQQQQQQQPNHPLQNEWVIWEHKANTNSSNNTSKDPDKWKENMKQLCEFSTVEQFWQYFTYLPKPSQVFFDGDCRKKVYSKEHERDDQKETNDQNDKDGKDDEEQGGGGTVKDTIDDDANADATSTPQPSSSTSSEGKTIEEYSLFKKGIEPEWGDPQNVTGGEWFCRQYFDGDVLDLYWKNLVMACIGETIEDAVASNSNGNNDNDKDRNNNNPKEEQQRPQYINGARVVDKSRHYPLFKIELWLNTRDPIIKEKIKNQLIDIITDGLQPPTTTSTTTTTTTSSSSSRKMQPQPKFDWRDHSG